MPEVGCSRGGIVCNHGRGHVGLVAGSAALPGRAASLVVVRAVGTLAGELLGVGAPTAVCVVGLAATGRTFAGTDGLAAGMRDGTGRLGALGADVETEVGGVVGPAAEGAENQGFLVKAALVSDQNRRLETGLSGNAGEEVADEGTEDESDKNFKIRNMKHGQAG